MKLHCFFSMPIGSELEINGSVYDDADQIRFDLQSYPKIKVRMKIDKYRMIAMHINPRYVLIISIISIYTVPFLLQFITDLMRMLLSLIQCTILNG